MTDPRISLSQRGVRAGLVALTAAILAAGVTWQGFAANRVDVPAAAAIEQTSTPVPSRSAALAGGRDSYADIVKVVAPSVVTVKTEGRMRMAPTDMQGDPNDFLHRFFAPQQFQQFPRGERPQQPQRRAPRMSALGSGVIVSSDGYILTNNHVIDNADSIHVDLTDGRTLDAKLVGSDAPSDLAVLKIEATNLQALALGDSDAVQVGDIVLAVGNPLNLGQTVTMGIISAKGRSTDREGYEDFLQTDAPINHGNSGGALVSLKGQLVGINSQIASVSDGNIGIGFAIPANMAKRVMTDLKSGGRVRRGQLGVDIQGVTSDLAQSLGLKNVGGAIVSGVTPGSAAEHAGMKREDVIVSFNGKAVQDMNALRNRVAETIPGSSVPVGIVRDGKEQTLTVKLDERATDKSTSNSAPSGREQNTLGVAVAPLTPELAQRVDVPKGVQGLLIQSVNPDSRAADAGLQPGDVIQEVNRQPVRTVDDLRGAVGRSADRPALLLVNREGHDIFVTVRPS